jgi:hypothetical protein
MDILDRHEVFEIELLDRLNSVKLLGQGCEITEAQVKRFTLLIEVRTGIYPKRLKI